MPKPTQIEQLQRTARNRAIAVKSCDVLDELGPDIQWIQSYAEDKIYCVYLVSDEEIVREHARRGGFPANRITEVRGIIDPATAAVQEPAVTGPYQEAAFGPPFRFMPPRA